MGAVTSEAPALPAALAELKSFLRISVSDEDALLAALARAAADLCEAFIGRALIERAVTETVAASAARTALTLVPVRGIDAVAAIGADGEASELPPEDYEARIDAHGNGRVRLRAAIAAERLRVAYRAGMAADWNGVPEALRHGIVRLAAHHHAARGRPEEGEIPAAVTALWRPWRRLRLG